MSKISRESRSSPTKRRKLDHSNGKAESQPITSSKQLQNLLAFRQDNVEQTYQNLRDFKAFLEKVAYAEDKFSTKADQDILKSYIGSQTPKDQDGQESALCLPDLIQTWSLASQTRNDGLSSMVTVVLALLLRTISSLIDFREDGIRICNTILQQAQLKLITRALSSPKQKEHIISPCLRLLTEVVSFDGGALAKQVFANQTLTFDEKIISRSLSLWKAEFDPKKPSVRLNAIRYVLAHLRYQSSSIKADILNCSHVFKVLLEHLKSDPISTVKEVLSALNTHVISDKLIPLRMKSYIFNDRNLKNVADVLRQKASASSESNGDSFLSQIVYEFLHVICTNSNAGALRSSSGWYPPGTDKSAEAVDEEDQIQAIDSGLDSVEWYNRYTKTVPVRNKTLAAFAQHLRPFATRYEHDLLLDIFRAAPETVADYFLKKAYPFDPKLTATWIGYASFILSTIHLSPPSHFGRWNGEFPIPPPVSVILENILPAPLTQKVLTRCLNQSCALITFLVTRILVLAYQKLGRVLSMLVERRGSLWVEASKKLVFEFNQKCPKTKDLIAVLRKTPSEHTLQREAILRLLALSHEFAPYTASDDKVDVSSNLSETLTQYGHLITQGNHDEEEAGHDPNSNAMAVLELNHLLQISRNNTDLRWWNKAEGFQIAPFTILLKLVSGLPMESIPSSLLSLVKAVTRDHNILQEETSKSASIALVTSLMPDTTWQPSETLFEYLDDAFSRCVKKPVKYMGDYDGVEGSMESKQPLPVSLLHFTLIEQWPFVVSRDRNVANIATWLSRFTRLCVHVGEDANLLAHIMEKLINETENAELERCLSEANLTYLVASFSKLSDQDLEVMEKNSAGNETATVSSNELTDFSSLAPPQEDEKHSGLHSWREEPDLMTAVKTGTLTALIKCLSSAFPEVRRLAYSNLHEISLKLKALKKHQYPDAPQVYLLIALLVNTTSNLVSQEKQIPFFSTSYASHALEVVTNPLHPLYDKVCSFHCRGPSWEIERLPSYWAYQILFKEPTPSYSLVTTQNASSGRTDHSTQAKKNENHMCLSFLLDFVYQGLQTSDDLEILRKNGTLEPIIALIHDPFLPTWVEEMVLRIIWRATSIDGGSTTLITRQGIIVQLSRLVFQRNAPNERNRDGISATTEQDDGKGVEGATLRSVNGLKQLLRRLRDTCDQERVNAWSQDQLHIMVDRVCDT